METSAEKKITILTFVYNTKPYLEQCISSVLSQSYTNFEYILIDNGCTDGSSEILKAFAESDQRIRVIRYEENIKAMLPSLFLKMARGHYLARLDSDDWWEPDFLERMLGFLEENHLDYAMTGTVQYFQGSGESQVLRKLETPVVLTLQEFAQLYPQLWVFPSTTWASLITMDLLRRACADAESTMQEMIQKKYSYGGDTIQMLSYLEHSARIGIDDSALYHYRIHPKSVTYQYNFQRFDSNIAYYEHIRDFLERRRTFDSSKQAWLKAVHLHSMSSTLRLLRDSTLSAGEKLAECARIATHPLTATVLTHYCSEREWWISLMWEIIFASVSGGAGANAEDLSAVLQTLVPRCAAAIQPADMGLLARDAVLQKLVREDDPERLARQIMSLIAQKKYIKQYDLGRMLCGLISDGSPLRGISDTRFFRAYAESCTLILDKKYADALEQMTGVLFQNKKLYAAEAFLNLYLTLAALAGEVPAFLFGKIQLAQFYLDQGRFSECRSVLNELVEMGAESEELQLLQHRLEETRS